MSGIMYKNQPYGTGGGSGGGASALSQLSDVSLSSPSNGQILKYNETSGKWENANESGGGGGNTVYYGVNQNPSAAGNDGDLFYVLDSNNKKKGLFLYMTNEWVLIEGSAYSVETVLYDNGTESVAWTVSGGTKGATSISLNVGGGTYTHYAVTDNAIDLTDFNTLHVECRYRSRDYNLDLDISSYTGNKYISFTYLTDASHNEAAIGITDTQTGAATIRIDSRNGDTAEQLLYYMSLS